MGIPEFYVYAYTPSGYRSEAVPRDQLRPWASPSKRHIERYLFSNRHNEVSGVRRRVAKDLKIAPYEVVFLNTNRKSGLLITDADEICNIPFCPPGNAEEDKNEKGLTNVILEFRNIPFYPGDTLQSREAW